MLPSWPGILEFIQCEITDSYISKVTVILVLHVNSHQFTVGFFKYHYRRYCSDLLICLLWGIFD